MLRLYNIGITFNGQPVDGDAPPERIAEYIKPLLAAIRKLAPEYLAMLQAGGISVDISSNMGHVALSDSEPGRARLNTALFVRSMDPFPALRQEAVCRAAALLGEVTHRDEWKTAAEQDARTMRAKVLMALQRTVDEFPKVLPTSADPLGEDRRSLAEKMLPEMVAAENMLRQGDLWDRLFAGYQRDGWEEALELAADHRGESTTPAAQYNRLQARLKEVLYQHVFILVQGMEQDIEKFEHNYPYPNKRIAAVRIFIEDKMREHDEEAAIVRRLVDYYIEDAHGRTAGELMENAFPHLYKHYRKFQEDVAQAGPRMLQEQAIRDRDAIMDAYRIGDASAVETVRGILRRGKLTMDILEHLQLEEAQNPHQVAIRTMLEATLLLHHQATQRGGSMGAEVLKRAETEAIIDGQTAFDKALDSENYKLAGMIRLQQQETVQNRDRLPPP